MPLFPFAAFWTFNFNYWSGGIDEDPSLKLTWCQQTSAAQEGALKWESSALDRASGVNCLKFKIREQNQTIARTLKWSYKNCSWRFLPACRVFKFNKPFYNVSVNQYESRLLTTPPKLDAHFARET